MVTFRYFAGEHNACFRTCSNQREKTETTDKQIHSPGLTDELIRDAHIIYYSRFMSTSRLNIQFVSFRQKLFLSYKEKLVNDLRK
jgi:hypothetical protein